MKSLLSPHYIRPTRPAEPYYEDVDAYAYQLWTDANHHDTSYQILWLEVREQLAAA